MKQVWKRRAVVAAVLMLVGTSVYLNWRYAGNVENSGKKVLGQSALVNGETTDAEVDGVSAMMSANVSDLMGGKKMSAKGVRVEMDGEAIAVNLFIVVRYGSAIGDVAKKVQQMVRTALEGMTGFRVAAVNVHVGGISFN